MLRKLLTIAAISCTVAIAIGTVAHQRTNQNFASTPHPCQSDACQNKQDILNLFRTATQEGKTISGLYAGDDRILEPHWWDGAPAGRNVFEQFVGHVEERSGHLTGILEFRFTSFSDEREYGDLDALVNLINREAWRRGAIPAISTTVINPWNGQDERNKDIGEFDDLFTPGTEAYQRFHEELDFIAAGLEKLQFRGIPVLFRPFHENTGGWFWWGRATVTPEQYQHLWRYTFDYLENTHELDNLIWVYGASTSNYELIPQTYPGDDYVHVVGISNYGCNPGRSDVIASYETFKEIAPEKPFAFTELGPERDGQCTEHYNDDVIAAIEHDIPDLLYFLNWHGPRASLALYPNGDAVINHPDIWNADDILRMRDRP